MVRVVRGCWRDVHPLSCSPFFSTNHWTARVAASAIQLPPNLCAPKQNGVAFAGFDSFAGVSTLRKQ